MSDFDYLKIIGGRVGTCVILKELGKGSMGAVYTAYQTTLKRLVAVKILPKTSKQDRISVELFKQEAETIAILNHPNIVPVYETGEADTFYYLIMQLVQGKSLAEIVRRLRGHVVPTKRILPLKETIRIILQVLDALQYSHNEGIIHRDIKPANILMEKKTNRAMISDFGIARVVRGEDLQAGMIVGTPLYMSPEQAMGKQLDARTDIYAVGCVLFLLAAGELPVRKEDGVRTVMRKAKVPESFFIRKPSEVNPAIDLDLEKIILKATAANRDERYKDCGQFARHLMWYKEKHFKEEIAPPEDL